MTTITDLGLVIEKEEIDTLLLEIKKNKDLWVHETAYWGEERLDKPIYFLGSPIYAAKADPGLYRRLRSKSQSFLVENTSGVLKRTLELLIKKHDCSTYELLDDSSLPGFHILYKDKPHTEEYKYHQDKDYLEYYEAFNVKKLYDFDNFYSFVVPIEIPASGATLDFKIEDQVFSFSYETGHAYTWKADVWHKIGDVSFSGNDHRITFQGHFIVDSKKLLYYW